MCLREMKISMPAEDFQISKPVSRGLTETVLVVTPWYRPNIGGIVEIAECLLTRFTARGVRTVLLVADDSSTELTSDPSMPNVWHLWIPATAFHVLSLRACAGTLIRGARTFLTVRKFLKRHAVGTAILLYPCESDWPFVLLRYMTRLQVMTICQGNDLLKYEEKPILGRWLLRRILRASHSIVAAADHLVQKAQEIALTPGLPIHLIPNAVNLAHFTSRKPEHARKDNRSTLVHISNFNPKKRVGDIVRAFALAQLPKDGQLVLVGQGPDLEEAKKLAQELGVAGRVTFAGSQRDVRQYLWEADLFVMASDEESGPIALLEAMACGVPWIATRWGIAAMLPEDTCGLLVPARSPERLAEAMSLLMGDPQRRHRMGLAAMRLAKDFSEEVYVNKHLECLR